MIAGTTLIDAMSSLADWGRALLRRPSRSAHPRTAHPFDARYGVDTSGLLYPDNLPTGHAHDRYSEGYYGTAPSVFHRLLEQWRAMLPAGLRLEDYAFVDLGCGKGRVVMLASMYGFRAVAGVELNPRLARVARRNLGKWMRGARGPSVSVEVGDVLDFELPEGPVVLFLFNSFGVEVLGPLLAKVAEEARRRASANPIDLLYLHPDHDALVAAVPGVELLRYVEIPFSAEDAAADAFGVSSEVCSIYRIGLEAPENRGCV